MLRKIIEVLKKHPFIIADIVLTILSVLIPIKIGLDVRPFLIIPAILIYCDGYVMIFHKHRIWRLLLSLTLGIVLSYLFQGLIG